MAESATFWDAVEMAIRDAAGTRFHIADTAPVHGGDINRSYRVNGGVATYFVKVNAAKFLDMFEAERCALHEIEASGTIRAPAALCCSRTDKNSFLALEYLKFSPRAMDSCKLGEHLAALHGCTRPRHGWDRDNTIGTTAQLNPQTDSWLEFWRDSRLAPQLKLAASNSAPAAMIESGGRLLEKLPELFGNHEPVPSLLHGDLWRGNVDSLEDGTPVVFDPASYYGDRETDIAMSELFGGFDSRFYDTYRAAWPLAGGCEARADMYRLYHLLNHFNLFGGGYARQSHLLIERLLGTY